jgi:transaldolase
VISPPYHWQKRYNASDVTVENRMDRPVDPAIIEELMKKYVDFRRAYDERGMRVEEFDDFGATVRTLRQFIQATCDLTAIIRDFMLPKY